MKTEKINRMCDGKGYVVIQHIVDEEKVNPHCGLYAKVILEQGCSVGYHEHHGESETYYILSGEGEYNDNGVIRKVKAGDVTHTPSGYGHELINTGMQNLEFMALILKD